MLSLNCPMSQVKKLNRYQHAISFSSFSVSEDAHPIRMDKSSPESRRRKKMLSMNPESQELLKDSDNEDCESNIDVDGQSSEH